MRFKDKKTKDFLTQYNKMTKKKDRKKGKKLFKMNDQQFDDMMSDILSKSQHLMDNRENIEEITSILDEANPTEDRFKRCGEALVLSGLIDKETFDTLYSNPKWAEFVKKLANGIYKSAFGGEGKIE